MDRARNYTVLCNSVHFCPSVTGGGVPSVTITGHRDGDDWSWSSVQLTEDAARALLAGLRAHFAESAEPPYLSN
jgi:hypothetical protein